MAYDFDTNEQKKSSKGVQHSVSLSYDDFKTVFKTDQEKIIQNVIIKSRNGQMTTQESTKSGLRNAMIKGYVEEDGVTVRPFSKFL